MTFANPNSRLNPSRPQAFSIHEPAPSSEGGNPKTWVDLASRNWGARVAAFAGIADDPVAPVWLWHSAMFGTMAGRETKPGRVAMKETEQPIASTYQGDRK